MCLLAATDMVLVSLLPRSIEHCRNDERDLDLAGMIAIVPPQSEVDDGYLKCGKEIGAETALLNQGRTGEGDEEEERERERRGGGQRQCGKI